MLFQRKAFFSHDWKCLPYIYAYMYIYEYNIDLIGRKLCFFIEKSFFFV